MLQLQAERLGKRKITTGRGRRTVNPDSIEMDSTSYRLVSKCWALGEFENENKNENKRMKFYNEQRKNRKIFEISQIIFYFS